MKNSSNNDKDIKYLPIFSGTMNDLYTKAKQNGNLVFHKNYSLFNDNNLVAFDGVVIQLITLDVASEVDNCKVSVFYQDGSSSQWSTKWISSYIFQFGIAVSEDGQYIFVQTWENGMICLDSHTGKTVWKTKSKRGITSVFVNDDTVLCQQHEYALQLLDIHTGEVLKEKRPATSWGFISASHDFIVCQMTARRWEIIDTVTLATKTSFSHRDFTGDHEDYCVNNVRISDGVLTVRGFKNEWHTSMIPPKLIRKLEYEHSISIDI